MLLILLCFSEGKSVPVETDFQINFHITKQYLSQKEVLIRYVVGKFSIHSRGMSLLEATGGKDNAFTYLSIGKFYNYEKAKLLKNREIRGSFVVAVANGKKISLEQAKNSKK